MGYRGEPIWRFIDATDRDATGSDDGLQVGNVAAVDGLTGIYSCATVAASSSTWASAGGAVAWSTYHNFNQTSLAENYIPINDLAEVTTPDYYHKLLTRNTASKILRVIVWPAAINCGDTVIRVYSYDKPQSTATATLLKTSPTVDMNTSAAFTFDFTGDPPLYTANQLGGISIDTNTDGPDQCCIRIDWEEQ